MRATGLSLIAIGAIGIVAALFVPWSWAGPSSDSPGALTWAALLCLVPAVSTAVLLRLRMAGPPATGSRPTGPWFAAGAALLAGVIAAGVLLGIPPDHGLAAGGPIAVLSCATAVAGWLLRGLAGLVPLRREREGDPEGTPASNPQDQRAERPHRKLTSQVVAVVVAPALVAASVPTIHWYVEGRFVRAVTAGSLAAVPDTSPARLDRYRWEASAERFDLLVGPVVAGRHLVLPEGTGVRVLDVVTGGPRWSYVREDVPKNQDLSGVVAVDGGRLTVLAYNFAFGALVVALDTATGEERWRARVRVPGVPRLADGGGVVLLDSTYLGGSLVSLDVRDGAIVWRWETDRLEDSCGSPRTSLTVAGGVAVLGATCPRDPDGGTVIGLSVTDGAQRWAWRAQDGLDLPVRADGDRVRVPLRNQSAVVLDAGTGAVGAEHRIPGGSGERYRLPLLVSGVAVYADAPVTAVDLGTGEVRWRLTEPAGWRAVDGVVRDGVAYLLLMPEESGPARLLAVDVASGEVRGEQPYDPARCGAGCHPDDQARVLVGPGLLVVGSREPDGFRLRAVG